MCDDRTFHEVWDWNLNVEFDAMVAAVKSGKSSIVALDTEFPGFLRGGCRTVPRDVRYQTLRENVDRLRLIQVGLAVAGTDGSLRGVWNFNLQFDVTVDLHTESAVNFLRRAGIDFDRHAHQGIEAKSLGWRLARSCLVGAHPGTPLWVTFTGEYDFGFLLKLMTCDLPLPHSSGTFDALLATFCPKRHELRSELPTGSLENLSREKRVNRRGMAHTAGSDALLTLEMYLLIVRCKEPEPAGDLDDEDEDDLIEVDRRHEMMSYHVPSNNGMDWSTWQMQQNFYAGATGMWGTQLPEEQGNFYWSDPWPAAA